MRGGVGDRSVRDEAVRLDEGTDTRSWKAARQAAASSARARRVGAAIESELDMPGGEVVQCMGLGERGWWQRRTREREDYAEGGENPEREELWGGDLDHYHGVVLEHGGLQVVEVPLGGVVMEEGGGCGQVLLTGYVCGGGPERKLRVSSTAGHFERCVEEKLRMVMLGEVAQWTARGGHCGSPGGVINNGRG
ncbi:hypothetical protein K439DRAFT_1621356 [Ramaria rubella]|nr:hypothetical protein K439DRAFT_1621356 [Ramaria rubella]